MALSKVVYVNGVTVITAENLNDIQDAIIALEGGASITVDAVLSTTSTNPVQNKVVKAALDGKYAKPAGGIPKTDLAAAVQTSLGKADTALQSAPVTSVNGQTGAVTLSIPSTASDVGAVASNQGVSHAGEFLVVDDYGSVTTQAMTNAETEAL